MISLDEKWEEELIFDVQNVSNWEPEDSIWVVV